ncbi:MAG: protein kinase [Acidobacteriota bacterium]|nr:protein kinase [Acidobacteriota bacterium]
MNSDDTPDDRSERLIELFEQAIQLPPAERKAFLAEACRDDVEMRAELESLLDHANNDDGALPTSAIKLAARQLADASRRDWAGEQVGHYQILRLLGEGGMGEVWLAEDSKLNRQVAIKFLTAHLGSSPALLQRFEREARAASMLNHPNIITVHEIGQHEETVFIAYEFVEGRTLRQRLQDSKPSWQEAVGIGAEIAAALNAAHNAGIIHRDIKPENVMLRADGLVKALDFGIAKRFDLPAAETSGGNLTSQSNATLAGLVLGTPGYLSPEQARGEKEIDARTDIFSLGVLMYEMLAGHPYAKLSLQEKLEAVRKSEELPPLNAQRKDLPAALDAVVKKATRKSRDERLASAGEMLDALNELRPPAQTKLEERARTLAEKRANQLLNQAVALYASDKSIRLSPAALWTIGRHSTVKRGSLESSLLRRSYLSALGKVAAIAMLAGLVTLVFTAWNSVEEKWDERVLRDGHTAGVRRAAFSPNGHWLVSVGEDSRVRVWDFNRRELKRELKDHTAWVVAVSFSPDGRFLATASWDRSVIVWDAESLEKIKVLHDPRGPFTGVAFSPDGKYLAAGLNVGTGVTAVWHVESWEKHREIPMYSGDWSPLLFSPKHPQLLFNAGQTFDVETGQEVKRPAGFDFAAGVEFSRDGLRLVTVRIRGEVVFYDPARGKAICSPHFVHHDNGRAVAFSPDGKLVATGADDIILWNAATQEIITQWDHSAEIWGLTWSPDGQYLVSTHDDGSILLWDVIARERAGDLAQHSSPVAAVAFSPDGQHIASGSEDRSVLIWNAYSGRKEMALVGHQSHVNGVAFSPDSQWLVSNGWDGELIRWELAERQPRWRVKTDFGAKRISISPEGRWIAAFDGVYDAATGKLLFQYSSSLGVESWGTMSAAISADGKRLAAAGFGRLCVWETEQWRLLGQIKVGDSGGAAMSPDGRYIIIGNVSGELMLFQTDPLARIGRLGNHATRVKQIAFSPDGTQVASVGDDQKIRLWQVATRRQVAEIGIHTASISAIAFSPDGKQLASGGHDKSVRVFTRQHRLWGRKLDESNWLLRLLR